MRLLTLFLIVLLYVLPIPVIAAELVVISSNKKQTDNDLSLTEEHFQTGLATLIAERSHRTLRMLIRPRKRLAQTLETGEADLLCSVMPTWLPGKFEWSQGFIDVADVLVSAQRVPAPKSIQDIATKRVGTVLGYAYPETDRLLGVKFYRDDGPTDVSNLEKLEKNRYDYAIVNQYTLLYIQRQHQISLHLNPPLPIEHHQAGCALSLHSSLTIKELNQIITDIQHDGSLQALLTQYPH